MEYIFIPFIIWLGIYYIQTKREFKAREEKYIAEQTERVKKIAMGLLLNEFSDTKVTAMSKTSAGDRIICFNLSIIDSVIITVRDNGLTLEVLIEHNIFGPARMGHYSSYEGLTQIKFRISDLTVVQKIRENIDVMLFERMIG